MSSAETWPELPNFPLAACRGIDTSVFFAERGQSVAPAVAICNACRELEACRAWAMAAPAELVGIFGGWGQKRRGIERRRRQVGLSLAIDQVESESAPLELEAPVSSNGYHEPVTAAPDRVCPGCGGAVTGPASRKWCSERCRRANAAHSSVPSRESRPVTLATRAPSLPAQLAPLVVGYLIDVGQGDPWVLTRSAPPHRRETA